jgi:hypothetical protein
VCELEVELEELELECELELELGVLVVFLGGVVVVVWAIAAAETTRNIVEKADKRVILFPRRPLPSADHALGFDQNNAGESLRPFTAKSDAVVASLFHRLHFTCTDGVDLSGGLIERFAVG